MPKIRLKNRCTVDGCLRRRAKRCYCGMHYTRWLRHGDPLKLSRPAYRRWKPGLLCEVPACGEPRNRRQFCHKHYSRWRRWGDPEVLGRAVSTPGVTQLYKAEYVKIYKLEHGCADCGYNCHHAALDFDHRLGTSKVRDIKSGQQFGWEALLAEIEKCDVVCANCHRIRTFERVREVV